MINARLLEGSVLTSMEECAGTFDGFLAYNRKDVLKGKGQRNRKQAVAKAKAEFAKFQKIQNRAFENDFQKQMRRLEGGR